MSTVHFDSSFQNSLKPTEVRVNKNYQDKRSYTAHTLRNREDMLFIQYSSTILHNGFKCLTDAVTTVLKESASTQKLPQKIEPPLKGIVTRISDKEYSVSTVNALNKKADELIAHFAGDAEQIKIVNRARNHALAWFEEKEVTLNLSLDLEYYGYWKEFISTLSVTDLYEGAGAIKLDIKPRLSEEEMDFFNIDSDQANEIYLNQISCLTYALFKTREPMARELLLKTINPDTCLDNFLYQLVDWGYRNVPSPNRGDIVVYLDDKTKMPTHVGIVATNGRIHSKLGVKEESAYMHDLSQVHPIYGSTVVFFRKSGAKLF